MPGKTKITIMGSGGSGGVPYSGNVWGICDPANPKNRRTRPSIFIQRDDTNIVVDTGPEFRMQINATGFTGVPDAVLYTHCHADHVQGIDDLRSFWFKGGKNPIPVYSDTITLEQMQKRFDYAFETLDSTYPAMVTAHELQPKMTIGALDIVSFAQQHGNIRTSGFRVGNFAYSTDTHELPDASLEALHGVRIWVVGAHPSDDGHFNHAGLKTLEMWMNKVKPEKVFLTHLNAYADYDTMCRDLPENVRPAYDGLEILVD